MLSCTISRAICAARFAWFEHSSNITTSDVKCLLGLLKWRSRPGCFWEAFTSPEASCMYAKVSPCCSGMDCCCNLVWGFWNQLASYRVGWFAPRPTPQPEDQGPSFVGSSSRDQSSMVKISKDWCPSQHSSWDHRDTQALPQQGDEHKMENYLRYYRSIYCGSFCS